MEKVIYLHKMEGETPLFCMQRFQKAFPEYLGVPMTYAGRLDPMASGILLCLVGEECKKKNEYLKFDKEYIFEILVGAHTDTFDLLGIVDDISVAVMDYEFEEGFMKVLSELKGRIKQKYPPFSSRTIEGVALHELARSGNLPSDDSYPTNEVSIYSIKRIGARKISGVDLLGNVAKRIGRVQGDFRQMQIIERWKNIVGEVSIKENSIEKIGQVETGEAKASEKDISFQLIECRVLCSSGTYVRGLVDQISKEMNIPMCAFSIERTKILYVSQASTSLRLTL